jgi:hexulose-6-phosphate isomerase
VAALPGGAKGIQFPEHWIPLLGNRIQNVHLEEWPKDGTDTDFSLAGFRLLLDGTTDWPAVMEAFEKADCKGRLSVEHFKPWRHYLEAPRGSSSVSVCARAY